MLFMVQLWKIHETEKDYLKWTSKPSYMSQRIFDNNVIAVRKIKLH